MMAISPTARKILASPFPILGAWLLAGVLTILVPLSKWKKQRKQWYNYYGRYAEYENNQRMYEEQQNQQNQYNNQYNNGNQGNGYYDRDGRWIPSCSWWQVKCRQQRMYYMAANGDQNQMINFPNWYATIGGKMEEEGREREERGENPDEASGALKFVYTWTMIVFIALLVFGSITIFKKKPLTPLIVIMLIVGQFALLQLVLIGQGVIETEGREMEDSYYGWYGQLPVLMVYTDWGYFLFSIGFSILLTAKIFVDRYILKDETEPVLEDSEYKTMNAA